MTDGKLLKLRLANKMNCFKLRLYANIRQEAQFQLEDSKLFRQNFAS